MAKNDTILLDGIIDQRLEDGFPSKNRDEVFEYFCFEQVLKNYDLSCDEIESGWVDGRDDGGIDGFFTSVNGHLLRDPQDFSWPKANAEITVWVLTCKHHDTYQQAPLNSLYASITELFDFSIDRKHFKGAYSEALADARSLFHVAYQRLAAARPTLSIRFAYISRGDRTAVAPNITARANQIVETTRPLFSSSECQFDFIGAAELVAMYRRAKKFSIELPVLEFLSRGSSGYIVLAGLKQYADFVTDDIGNLRRYLFDSNVRDYLGQTQVNEDILNTLRDSAAPAFWWLNNGVTILATGATVVGKTINLTDIQIVNGLQTTESIYRHFRSGGKQTDDSLMVKIVVSTDVTHRDRIIQATNNQNVVETTGLRATDKIQRDIEEHLDQHGWYYERRKNYYKNIGKPPERFVTPMYIAAGYVALVLKNPVQAVKLKSRFMRKDKSYEVVFSSKTGLDTWVAIVEILKRTEELLRIVRPSDGSGENFMKSWRNLVAFLMVARLIGKFSYCDSDLVAFELASITDKLVAEIWGLIQSEMGSTYKGSSGRKSAFVTACYARAAVVFGIADVDVIGKRSLPMGSRESSVKRSIFDRRSITLSRQFLDQVDAALPPQPWKPGVHKEIADQLGCSPAEVTTAIGKLIKLGRWNQQRDGVVYAPDGSIVSVDPAGVKRP